MKSLRKLVSRTTIIAMVLFALLSVPVNVFAEDPPVIVGGGSAPSSDPPIIVGGGGLVSSDPPIIIGGGGLAVIISLLL